MKGAIIFNKYYSDDGMRYIFERLKKIFLQKGVTLEQADVFNSYNIDNNLLKYRFAVFFDKDIALARFLERNNIRVFNCAKTIELCDDKEKTFDCVSSIKNICIPKTIGAPLRYIQANQKDENFLKLVTDNIIFPIVVKENMGSQGKQVYLAENSEQLENLYSKLLHTPHIYQEFVGEKKGEDIRVYIVGKKALALAKRTNTTDFRANVAQGGIMQKLEMQKSFKVIAEKIAASLNLEYGSVDFIDNNGVPVFIEANSNVYLKGIEDAGVNIAEPYADYILEQIK